MQTIVIFANSVKHHQHCVAGKCWTTNHWIRLVSDRDGSELTRDQAMYRNPHGRFLVKPLQKILVELGPHVPLDHQPDNYLVTDTEWVQKYKIEIDEINSFLDEPPDLWGPGASLDADAICQGLFTVQQSLYLIQVHNTEPYRTNTNRRRVRFSYNERTYDLPVTDPTFDDILTGRRNHNDYLCLSLGEKFQDKHWKIVASIF